MSLKTSCYVKDIPTLLSKRGVSFAIYTQTETIYLSADCTLKEHLLKVRLSKKSAAE